MFLRVGGGRFFDALGFIVFVVSEGDRDRGAGWAAWTGGPDLRRLYHLLLIKHP